MVSIFEIFKIGIGPSSSHTVGPMRAAAAFMASLGPRLAEVARVRVILLGSLAWTGHGHASDKAVLLGLAGEIPEFVDPALADALVARTRATGRLALLGRHEVAFDTATDLVMDREGATPHHPNTLVFLAFAPMARRLPPNAIARLAAGLWCMRRRWGSRHQRRPWCRIRLAAGGNCWRRQRPPGFPFRLWCAPMRRRCMTRRLFARILPACWRR